MTDNLQDLCAYVLRCDDVFPSSGGLLQEHLDRYNAAPVLARTLRDALDEIAASPYALEPALVIEIFDKHYAQAQKELEQK